MSTFINSWYSLASVPIHIGNLAEYDLKQNDIYPDICNMVCVNNFTPQTIL